MNPKIIITVISFSLTLILVIFLISPTYQELRILERKNEEKKAEIQERERYFEELERTAEELKKYQSQLAKIDCALPSESDSSDLLAALFYFLQNTSSNSGLILDKISDSSSRSSSDFKGLKETEVTLNGSGSYSSLKNFLVVLEKSARLIEVESISLSSTKEGDYLDFNLKIKVYSY